MRDEVRQVFPSFTTGIEGRLGWMYLDVEGLVTTGVGNLIDPEPAAHALPWKRRDGSLASPGDVSAEWQKVKAMQGARKRGGVWFAGQTELRLYPADIDALVRSKLDQLEGQLRAGFGKWDSFPATAQLGILSMGWALGGAFGFPKFRAAVNAQDWATCAGPDGDANVSLAARGEAWIRDGAPGQVLANENPGLRRRNLANKRLFAAAASGASLADALA